MNRKESVSSMSDLLRELEDIRNSGQKVENRLIRVSRNQTKDEHFAQFASTESSRKILSRMGSAQSAKEHLQGTTIRNQSSDFWITLTREPRKL
ncbi:MAG: hypothetical protein ACREBS_08260 [Nitrososphaerales archaeon]